jgi:hypothetical protein
MIFEIEAGGHKARVTLKPDGRGGFSGEIASAASGTGRIGGVITGDHLSGSAVLDGHQTRFDATLADGTIRGSLTAGWFFRQDFRGREIAA